MCSVKEGFLLLLMVLLAGCGGMTDDLVPSGSDKRPAVVPGTTGPLVGQNAPDFTLPDTLGTSVTLSSVITTTGVKGAVLYFTMWCPICDSHMSCSVMNCPGVVERGWIENGKLYADLRFSPNDEITPLWNNIQAGIVRNVSTKPVANSTVAPVPIIPSAHLKSKPPPLGHTYSTSVSSTLIER